MNNITDFLKALPNHAGYSYTAYPSPPHTKADEVKALLEAAVETCKVEPTQELFDKILDRVYSQESVSGDTPMNLTEFMSDESCYA